MFNLGNLTVGVGADLTGLDRSLSTAGNMFTKFAKGVGLGFALNIGSGLANMTLGSPVDFLSDAVKLAAQYETAATQFSVMLDQSDVKAARMMTNLRAFAAESPLTLTSAVEESKKLLSAGIGEDQIIPSLRMLSDLAVGSTTKLKMLSVAYTQVIAAGKLYGTEFRQFTETGIPLAPALANYLTKENLARGLEPVKEADIRPMMERSDISARHLQGALRDMVSEGGKFFDMTKRGAMTTEGQFERLTDSFEEFKRTLGKAIIEEFGLKEILGNGQNFNNELAKSVEVLRPTIHFLGDLFKGLVYSAGEFLKVAPAGMDAFGKAVRAASPELGKVLDSIQRGVDTLMKFELNPVKAVEIAFEIGAAVGEFVEPLLNAIFKLVDNFGAAMKDIYNQHIKPIVDSVDTAAKILNVTKAIVTAPTNIGTAIGERIKGDLENKRVRELGETGLRNELSAQDQFMTFFKKHANIQGSLDKADLSNSVDADGGKARMALLDIAKQIEALTPQIASSRFLMAKFDLDQSADGVKIYKHHKDVEKSLMEKRMGLLSDLDGRMGAVGIDRFAKGDGTPYFDHANAGKPFNMGDGLKEIIATLKSDTLSGLKATQERLAAKNAAPPLSNMDQTFGIVGMTSEMALFTDGMRRLADSASGASQKLELMADNGRNLQAEADKIKLDHLDPVRNFAIKQNRLLEMKGFGQINDREFTLEYSKILGETQKLLGPAKLPTAAEYGGEAVAALYAKMVGDTGPLKTEDLLKQLVEITRLEYEQTKEYLNNATGGKPPVQIMPLPMR